jgi:riboflavin synthase
MFTGIIKAIGHIAHSEPQAGGARLRVAVGALDLSRTRIGDSIAVNGVCLTATSIAGDDFTADVSAETLACTTLGTLARGARVNLEPALALGDALGGHLVSGHVDGVGELQSLTPEGSSLRMRFTAPAPLARYIAAKGSICVDGVSLTVNMVEGACFAVNIVPHTTGATILDEYRPGQRVNLEVDLIARYLERLLSAGEEGRGITREFLSRHGFPA